MSLIGVGERRPLLLFEELFDDADLEGRGWYDLSGTPEVSGGEIEYGWSAGQQIPPSGGLRRLFQATESLYIRAVVRFSSNWVGSGNPFDPHMFMVLTDADGAFVSPASNQLVVQMEQYYSSGIIAALNTRDLANVRTDLGAVPIDLTGVTEDRAVSGCNGLADGTSPTDFQCYGAAENLRHWAGPAPMINPGDTDQHELEVYLRMNTVSGGVGQPDGIVRYWIDDALAIDRDDVVIRTGARADQRFDQFFLTGFIGGSGSPIAQSYFVDTLELRTARP